VSDHVNLPEWVERLEPWPSVEDAKRAKVDMTPTPDGRFIHVADLPAVLAQRDQEWRDGLLGEAAVEALKGEVRPRPGDYLQNHHCRRGIQAAIDKAAPDGRQQP
jgi:hypothetical protein